MHEKVKVDSLLFFSVLPRTLSTKLFSINKLFWKPQQLVFFFSLVPISSFGSIINPATASFGFVTYFFYFFLIFDPDPGSGHVHFFSVFCVFFFPVTVNIGSIFRKISLNNAHINTLPNVEHQNAHIPQTHQTEREFQRESSFIGRVSCVNWMKKVFLSGPLIYVCERDRVCVCTFYFSFSL